MTPQIKVRDDIKVELLHHYGTDLHIAQAAWVSSGNNLEDPPEKRLRGVLRALLRDKHSTPFESGYFAFRVEAPRAVRDEAVRHRSASFSCSSLRYTHESPEVYVPAPYRPIKKAEGFKQIQPKYEPLSEEEYKRYREALISGYEQAYRAINYLRHELGREETEATRWLSLDGTYCSFIIRVNPRGLMNFLSLRTHEADANHPSYPMFEIEDMARQMEEAFKEKLPITFEFWNEFGREAV